MTVDASYRYCEQVARTQAKNFYYSFLLLDRPRRNAMCAIYAFMRYCDDLSDGEGVTDRAGAIDQWNADLRSALEGRLPDHAIWPAFVDAVERYKIPHAYFFDMISGVRSDLEPRRVATFADLYHYCYQVASVVGLTIIHIFGFTDLRALDLAEKCGIAFQLTNILRDVKEDAGNSRIYWPDEDLKRFGVSEAELNATTLSAPLREMLKFEATRARDYYRQSEPLVGLTNPSSQASMRALIGIYRKLLDQIEAADYNVMRKRIRVPNWQKAAIVARAWLG